MSHLVKFISDLHLEPSKPAITQAFEQFLQDCRHECSQLYILGDLFESWLGDDDDNEFTRHIAQQLKQLSTSACQIFFMHGNRDFLLGEQYTKHCGMALLTDPYIISPFGHPLLLMHGDTLCTDDIKYQQYRHYVRQPAVQHDFLSKSLAERHAFAQSIRLQSQEYTAQSAESIMDVTMQEVERVFLEHQVDILIHGHTHRPAHHTITLTNQVNVQRIVLGDWYTQASSLTLSEHGFDFTHLKPTT